MAKRNQASVRFNARKKANDERKAKKKSSDDLERLKRDAARGRSSAKAKLAEIQKQEQEAQPVEKGSSEQSINPKGARVGTGDESSLRTQILSNNARSHMSRDPAAVSYLPSDEKNYSEETNLTKEQKAFIAARKTKENLQGFFEGIKKSKKAVMEDVPNKIKEPRMQEAAVIGGALIIPGPLDDAAAVSWVAARHGGAKVAVEFVKQIVSKAPRAVRATGKYVYDAGKTLVDSVVRGKVVQVSAEKINQKSPEREFNKANPGLVDYATDAGLRQESGQIAAENPGIFSKSTIRGFVPGGTMIVKDDEAFRSGVKKGATEFLTQQTSQAGTQGNLKFTDYNKVTDPSLYAAAQTRKGSRSKGEVVSIVSMNTASEGAVRKILTGSSDKSKFKLVSEVSRQGGIEGGNVYLMENEFRGRESTPTGFALSSVAGAASAGLFETSLQRVGRKTKTGKTGQGAAYVVDYPEAAGDVIDSFRRRLSREVSDFPVDAPTIKGQGKFPAVKTTSITFIDESAPVDFVTPPKAPPGGGGKRGGGRNRGGSSNTNQDAFVDPNTNQDTTQDTTTNQDIIVDVPTNPNPNTGTTTNSNTGTTTQTFVSTSTNTRVSTNTATNTFTFTPPIPISPLKFGGGGPSEFRSKTKRYGKQKKAYKPSVTAVVGNIQGTPFKESNLSGLEFRPIKKTSKKKKKSRGFFGKF